MKKPNELTVPLQASAATTALVYPAADDAATTPRNALILGHGAGAGQRSTFMVDFARGLSALGIDVVTFNFLYTERTQTLNWPTWVVYLTLPIFAVSMTVHGLANLLEDLELVPRTPPKGFQLSELDGVN